MMPLQRLKGELLIAFAEDEAEHVALRALTGEIHLDVGASEFAADGKVQRDKFGVSAEPRTLMRKDHRFARRVLRMHVRELRIVIDVDVDDAGGQAARQRAQLENGRARALS